LLFEHALDSPTPEALREVRRAIREQLLQEGLPREHVSVVEAVASELVAAALEGRAVPVLVTVEPLRLLTSVRVRCAGASVPRDDVLWLRERILDQFALAHGQRADPDGGFDLWAEVERDVRPRRRARANR
jgi:hypothetical protein